MRLCSYVVVHDTGFAPNPFGRVCTLAACTPNHQGVRLVDGDWLVGNSSTATGRRLIYAMRVSASLDFDEYYRSPTFAEKRADAQSWQRRCGDNIYFRNNAGLWEQAVAFHHTSPRDLQKDTRYPRVFISDHFFYFGENAPAVPVQFDSLLQIRQGCRCTRDQAHVSAFASWIERTYKPGILGLPRDREEKPPHTSLVRIEGLNSL
jgi:hypothetical protein